MDQRTLNELAGELRDAFEQLGLGGDAVAGVARQDGPGELIVTVDGRRFVVLATARSDLRAPQAKELPVLGGREVDAAATAVEDADDIEPDPDADADTGIVFADRLSENTRSILQSRGWGWLDRKRGQLRLWCPGLRLDAAIQPVVLPDEHRRVRDPFTERGMRLALWLLLHPDDPASPREISRQIDVSAGQISNLLAALTSEALLRRDKRPLVPELFWAMADRWKPKRHALSAMPAAEELAHASELHTRHWVMGDTRAAMRYGAPVAVSTDYPPDLYVPDQKALSWLLSRSSLAPDFGQRIATVAVSPVSLVNEARFRRKDPEERWPLAHPIVVALDLAVDRNRGREVLDDWEPDESLGITRVW